MSRDIFVYVINGCSYESSTVRVGNDGAFKDTTEEFVSVLAMEQMNDAINSVIAQVGEYSDNQVNVHLVDPNYKVKYYYTPEGKKYFEQIHDMAINKADYGYIFHDCHWHEHLKEFVCDPNNHYFFLTPMNFENVYDFFNFLGIRMADNCYVGFGIKSLLEIQNAKCHYNIFAADVPDLPENPENEVSLDSCDYPKAYDEEAVQWIVEQGVKHVQELILCGVRENERFVQEKICSWSLNVEMPFMKGIILEYEIFPPRRIIVSEKLCVGKTIQETFMENAQYRFEIFDKMCRALAHYGLNTGKLKEVTNPLNINFDLLLH